MPQAILGNYNTQTSTRLEKLRGKDLGYEYPFDLDFRPGNKRHDDLVNKVLARADDSYSVMKKKHPVWRQMDRIMTAYIPLSDYEKKLKKHDETKPVSIVVPHSYAALETILSYNTKVFLQDPVFQFEGHGPEDTVGAKLLELVVNQQIHRNKSALGIHTGFRDGLTYGFHASSVPWVQKWGKKPVIEAFPEYTSLGTPLGIRRVKKNVPSLLFEGNEVIPIDPYRAMPDPNVSISDIQKGEFFGWSEDCTLNDLLQDEKGGGRTFNARYLHIEGYGEGRQWRSRFSPDESEREKEGTFRDQTTLTKRVTKVHMYIDIIPDEWNLPGDEEFNKDGLDPEKWLFTVANDLVLIDCAPLGLNHDMFPVAANSPDYDGYSIAPVSRMELTYGLSEVLNFMFNSHVTNVRKAINDMFVVDPSLISMKDLKNPAPGKLLRLRRTAWGRGVKDAIEQLKVNDVTRGNIADAAWVMDLMDKVGATPDAMKGVMRSGGERRSAAEFTGTFGAGISRLEHLATITSLMYMGDLAYFHASHTQQLMSEETYVRAIGDWPEVLAQEYGRANEQGMPSRLAADPYSIIADFDIIKKNGTTDEPDAAKLQFWQSIFPAIIGQPLLYGMLEVPKIFTHVARMSGEKNVLDFVKKGGNIQGQIVGDAAVLGEVDAGNLVPTGQEA